MEHEYEKRAVRNTRQVDPRQTRGLVDKWLRGMFVGKERRGVWDSTELEREFQKARVNFQRKSGCHVPDDLYPTWMRKHTWEFLDSTRVLIKHGTADQPLEVDKYRAWYIKCFKEQKTWDRARLEQRVTQLLKTTKPTYLPVPNHLHQEIMMELAQQTGGRRAPGQWTAKDGKWPPPG